MLTMDILRIVRGNSGICHNSLIRLLTILERESDRVLARDLKDVVRQGYINLENEHYTITEKGLEFVSDGWW